MRGVRPVIVVQVYFHDSGHLKNVAAAVRRGRLLRCVFCQRGGPTMGCWLDRCPKSYHLVRGAAPSLSLRLLHQSDLPPTPLNCRQLVRLLLDLLGSTSWKRAGRRGLWNDAQTWPISSEDVLGCRS